MSLELSSALKSRAAELGFDLAGIAPAVSPEGFHPLVEWVRQGCAGEMSYIERRLPAYEHPRHVLAPVRSVVVLGLNYRTEEPPPREPGEARVARYAWGSADYHDLIRAKLKGLADFLHAQAPGCRTRGLVDTAPLLERDFARRAGLGWFGKNTMLLNKRMGSWFFLAALLTDLELDYDEPHATSHCGTCRRCLDVCPTQAFPEPYVLDARKCISYLTIELRGAPIPQELREGVGEWLFGCDLCQEVCPWNRNAPVSTHEEFRPQDELFPASAVELLDMSEERFRERFGATPLARPGRAGLVRNACIVLGNSGDRRAIPGLIRRLEDESPVVRGAAAWALGRLGPDSRSRAAITARLNVEPEAEVREELREAAARLDAAHSETVS